MKLQKIVSRLQELHPKEIDLSLDRIQNLCKKLGNPQDKIKAISIVGTNGKYSTIQAMFSILKEANFNCNIYTSPHIKSINERFVFNNEELNDEDLANLLEFPILFYIVCISIFVTGKVDAYFITLAYWFFYFRVAHSIYHIFFNQLIIKGGFPIRSLLWIPSTATMVWMWVRFISLV